MNELVVLVDDSPEVGLLAQKLAKQGGYALSWCETAEEALSLVAEHQPQLILIDIRLPGLSGLDLCRQLGQSAPTPSDGARPLRAVFSHWDRLDEVRAALDAGAEGIVTKELLRRPAAWQERIQELLTAQRSGQAGGFSLSLGFQPIPSPEASWASVQRLLPALDRALRETVVHVLGLEVTHLLVERAARQTGVIRPVDQLAWQGSVVGSRWPIDRTPEEAALAAWIQAMAMGIWRLLGSGPARAFWNALQSEE